MNLLNFNRYGPLYSGCMFLLFTIVYATQFHLIRITPIGVVNSRVYPMMVLVLLGSMSIALILTSIRELRKTKDQAPATVEKKDYRCVLITLLLSAAYVASLQTLGFLIASVLYIYLQILNLCPRKEFKPIKFGVVAVVSAFVVYTFFRYGLTLMLPGGLLTGIF